MRKDETQLTQNWEVDWPSVAAKYYWHTRRHYQRVEQYLHGSILDVGCGLGFLAARTFPNEGNYTGVDYAASGLSIARSLFPGATFKLVNIAKERLPFPDSSFDTVVCSETLEHLDNFYPVMSECRRCARQYMLFTVPISMGGCGHVWPEWSISDCLDIFKPLGTLLELRHCPEDHFNLIWLRK